MIIFTVLHENSGGTLRTVIYECFWLRRGRYVALVSDDFNPKERKCQEEAVEKFREEGGGILLKLGEVELDGDLIRKQHDFEGVDIVDIAENWMENELERDLSKEDTCYIHTAGGVDLLAEEAATTFQIYDDKWYVPEWVFDLALECTVNREGLSLQWGVK